jgi:hypothetical protein
VTDIAVLFHLTLKTLLVAVPVHANMCLAQGVSSEKS